MIIRNETVACRSGEMAALIGPSGSGKTTLLHALGLLLLPTEGEVLADGHVISQSTSRQRLRFWREHVAFVLQDYGIIDEESVAFNVTLQGGRREGRQNAQILAALERVGLASLHEEKASHLSGGEKQRLSLARAIFRNAPLLLVDEPTASLDAANRRLVVDLLQELAMGGATVVISTHDEDMTAVCDHVHHLNTQQTGTVLPSPSPAGAKRR